MGLLGQGTPARFRTGLSFCMAVAALAAVTGGTFQAQSDTPRRVSVLTFEDTNGNGQRDSGEAAVPGVVVSDQFSVARTSEDGVQELQAASQAEVVFLSLPEGWTCIGPCWRPVAATNGERQRLEFPLQRVATVSAFSFIHASDLHLDRASLPRMQRLRETVEALKPAFVVITGDLIRDALRVPEARAREQYELLVAELAKFPVPVWTVPGNHENFGIERHLSLVSSTHPLFGKKMYRRFLGPNYFSFNHGGVHFVGLDTVDISDLWYYGHVNAEQLEWLTRDVAAVPAGTPVVTFDHIPFASTFEGLSGYEEEGAAPSLIRIEGKLQFRHVVSNVADVLAVIRKDHRLEIALGGHYHAREAIAYEVDGQHVRIHQAGAVIGPSTVAGLRMASGITLYRVEDGRVDDGEFVPLK